MIRRVTIGQLLGALDQVEARRRRLPLYAERDGADIVIRLQPGDDTGALAVPLQQLENFIRAHQALREARALIALAAGK